MRMPRKLAAMANCTSLIMVKEEDGDESDKNGEEPPLSFSALFSLPVKCKFVYVSIETKNSTNLTKKVSKKVKMKLLLFKNQKYFENNFIQ